MSLYFKIYINNWFFIFPTRFLSFLDLKKKMHLSKIFKFPISNFLMKTILSTNTLSPAAHMLLCYEFLFFCLKEIFSIFLYLLTMQVSFFHLKISAPINILSRNSPFFSTNSLSSYCIFKSFLSGLINNYFVLAPLFVIL